MTEGDRRWLVVVVTRSGEKSLLHNVPGANLQHARLRLGEGERALVAPMDEVTTFDLPGIEVKPTLTKQYMRALDQQSNWSPLAAVALALVVLAFGFLAGIGVAEMMSWTFG